MRTAGGGGYDYIDGGGGAGGSLFLTAPFVTGTGVISANGGSSPGNGGGGGGGRIALYYVTNSFRGALTAYGGGGLNRVRAARSSPFPKHATNGLTLIDNGGTPRWVTRLNTSFWPAKAAFDLTVAGAADMVPDMPLTFGNLLVTSGGDRGRDPAQGILSTRGPRTIFASMSAAPSARMALATGPASGPGVGRQLRGLGRWRRGLRRHRWRGIRRRRRLDYGSSTHL